MVVLVQPSAWPRMIANVRANRPVPANVRPPRSSVLSGPWDSLSILPASGIRASPTGDVEPEDPLPGDSLHDGAADERAERDAQSGDAAPDPQGGAAALGGEGLAHESQRERGNDRRSDSLQRPGRDQCVDRRCQGRRGAREGEDAHTDQEHPLAAEPVAEGGAGQQQHGEGERVGVDRPLQRLDRAAEIRAD